jgi:hypothetical protein
MKKIIFTLSIFTSTLYFSQITTVTNGFSTNLTKSDLNFSGDRKLHAIGLNDKTSENYVVVSKNKSGAESDELYVDKFRKNSDGSFTKVATEKFTHPINLSLSFVNNRMMYGDVDKDGNGDFIYNIEQNKNGVESPLEKAWGLVVFNNKTYKLWKNEDDNFKKTYTDEAFQKLPEAVKTKFLDFFNKLY